MRLQQRFFGKISVQVGFVMLNLGKRFAPVFLVLTARKNFVENFF